MASQTVPTPEYIQALQQKVFQILGTIIQEPTHIQIMFDQQSMVQYWLKVFTHISVDATNNYEMLEFNGDKHMNCAFADYIEERFKDQLNQEKATLLMTRYMSKKFQAELSERLGLDKFVRFDPAYPDVTVHVKEDVLEAFFGCLRKLADDRISRGLGHIYCYNLLTVIFADIPISLEDVQKDVKTQLKELYEKMGWGEPKYVPMRSDDPRRGDSKVEIRSVMGDFLGAGYGSQKDAEFRAAEEALRTLANQGITAESAERQRLERSRTRNPEFDLQYRRVEAAVQKLNQAAAAAGKAPIREFKIGNIGSHQGTGGTRYTFAVQLSYQNPDGTVAWRSVKQYTGGNSDDTKIQVMREFANQYSIPATL